MIAKYSLGWGFALGLAACSSSPSDVSPEAGTTTLGDSTGRQPVPSSTSGDFDGVVDSSSGGGSSVDASSGDSSSSDSSGSTTAPESSSTGAPSTPFVVMTFNIRHGAESSLDAVAQVITDVEPDVVVLQEVDQNTVRSGNVFQADVLGEMTNMESVFFASMPFQGGEYGLSLLSMHPISASSQVNLTSEGEPRLVTIAELLHPTGVALTIANTHMGLTAAEREVQAVEVLDALAGRPNLVLMGDLNAEPTESTIATFEEVLVDGYAVAGALPGFTFPATAPNRRIDYVLLGPEWSAPTAAVVVDTVASDHRPVVVELSMP